MLLPEKINSIKNKIAIIKEEKNKEIRLQKFEEAASLRDIEKRLQDELKALQDTQIEKDAF